MSAPGPILLCFAWLAPLLAADYFPLAPGNAWVYRLSIGPVKDVQTVEVEDAVQFAGRAYHRVRWFHGRTVYLRSGAGALYAFDPVAATESLWYSFTAREGDSFRTAADECSPVARVASTSSTESTPAGAFRDALTFAFELSCADAGVTDQVFAPDVGLVRHTETSISGPRRYDLVYARVGACFFEPPKNGFSLAIDRLVYLRSESLGTFGRLQASMLYARLTFHNATGQPLLFRFPGGRPYELVVRDARGQVVARTPDPALPAFEKTFPPGETNWADMIDMNLLPPGRYVAEAHLLTENPESYAASAPFEIVDLPR